MIYLRRHGLLSKLCYRNGQLNVTAHQGHRSDAVTHVAADAVEKTPTTAGSSNVAVLVPHSPAAVGLFELYTKYVAETARASINGSNAHSIG